MNSSLQFVFSLGHNRKQTILSAIGAGFHRQSFAIVIAIALAVPGLYSTAFAKDVHGGPHNRGDRETHWVGTWTASPQRPGTPPHFNGQTLRQILHTSIGGSGVRVLLSNTFGTQPLVVGAVHVAIRDSGPAIVPESDRVLTFSGESSITIPPGAPALSDPVELDVPALADLAVSIFLPDDTAATTMHGVALQTSYISPPGDYTDVITMPVMSTTQSWFFLAGVEVEASERTGTIVALGDSITDGNGSTPNTNNRWPNHLAERLLASRHRRMAVVDAGISGNRVLSDGSGVNALARFDRDVLVQPGVTHVIVLEGINDSGSVFVADRIIAGLAQLIERAHERGLKIFGGTLTPAGSTGVREENRQAVNDWIRTEAAFDAVIDFDEAVRDPDNPTFFLPIYDSGDHLHPSNAGYQAMADAIDLSLFHRDEDEDH
jgi:lysophospholipase L1-like esterase